MTDLVLAFWHHAPVLRRWTAFTSLLMLDKEEDQPLDDVEQRLVVRMLSDAAHTVLVQLHPSEKRKHKASYRSQMQAAADDMTIHMVKTLPSLMKKFRTEGTAMVNLASLTDLFQLSNVSKARLGGPIKSALVVVKKRGLACVLPLLALLSGP